EVGERGVALALLVRAQVLAEAVDPGVEAGAQLGHLRLELLVDRRQLGVARLREAALDERLERVQGLLVAAALRLLRGDLRVDPLDLRVRARARGVVRRPARGRRGVVRRAAAAPAGARAAAARRRGARGRRLRRRAAAAGVRRDPGRLGALPRGQRRAPGQRLLLRVGRGVRADLRDLRAHDRLEEALHVAR